MCSSPYACLGSKMDINFASTHNIVAHTSRCTFVQRVHVYTGARMGDYGKQLNREQEDNEGFRHTHVMLFACAVQRHHTQKYPIQCIAYINYKHCKIRILTN